MPTSTLLISDRADSEWSEMLHEVMADLGSLKVVSAEVAHSEVLHTPYDLIILDANAIEDPAHWVSSLRSQRPGVQVVVTTAAPSWQEARKVLRAGAVDYFSQTLNEAELSLTIHDILNRMAKACILFVDNDPDFSATRREFLEQDGYSVISASDVAEARRLLEEGNIDLAILDIRLVNDDDEKDMSGLGLANTPGSRDIPKIILTGFPSPYLVQELLRIQRDGRRLAIDVLAKEEGPEAMLKAVRWALSVSKEQ